MGQWEFEVKDAIDLEQGQCITYTVHNMEVGNGISFDSKQLLIDGTCAVFFVHSKEVYVVNAIEQRL